MSLSARWATSHLVTSTSSPAKRTISVSALSPDSSYSAFATAFSAAMAGPTSDLIAVNAFSASRCSVASMAATLGSPSDLSTKSAAALSFFPTASIAWVMSPPSARRSLSCWRKLSNERAAERLDHRADELVNLVEALLEVLDELAGRALPGQSAQLLAPAFERLAALRVALRGACQRAAQSRRSTPRPS